MRRYMNTKGMKLTPLGELLVERGLRQRDVAEAIDVHLNTIHYWCYGINEPNTESLRRLAVYLNVSTDYLLGLTKSREKKW